IVFSRNNISGFGPELHQLDLETTPRLASTSKQLGFKYTGVIYAAERFEQCRLFVRSSSEFSIFIPRPRYNTWCNAVEIDKIASVVIVMSNDRILPYDVTTKDDLFFHVTCNYTVPSITSAMKISLHDPRDRISLQILKKGIPVNSVFIGEILVVRVESDISPDRLHITACTAHRVGGTGPPTFVTLIADGCALLPSLMTPMKLGTRGWESSLSAFRIDGSEQIDVACMLDVCPGKNCPEVNVGYHVPYVFSFHRSSLYLSVCDLHFLSTAVSCDHCYYLAVLPTKQRKANPFVDRKTCCSSLPSPNCKNRTFRQFPRRQDVPRSVGSSALIKRSKE
ncbi:unnamed protein product, partial [Angiostrongylus costaricensis]|uniref:ZP domain-containing protein n=1 Tax=Angiostrongylus costaricensis TaxID=334426 RepID=A0A0R3PL18_ANGCS